MTQNMEALVEVQALIAKATQEDLTDGGRYFAETYTDLARCRHEEIGEYQHTPDGKLIEWLWNRRHEIAGMYAASPATPNTDAGAIPAGMVPWHGGERAPDDWDGGPVWTRFGELDTSPIDEAPNNSQWNHDGCAPSIDVIAYTPKSTLSADRIKRETVEACARAIEEWQHWGNWYGLDRNNRVAEEVCRDAAKHLREAALTTDTPSDQTGGVA